MKAFLVLLVLSLAGLAGVLYWRHTLQAPKAPATAAVEPAKDGKGKERRRRRKRGAKRLARNEVASAPTARSSSSAPTRDLPPGEAPPPVFAQEQPTGSAPVAPGGAATTEMAPEDVFGTSPSPSAAPSGGGRQAVVEEPEPVKLRPADLKIVWQGEDLSRSETMRLDFSKDAVGHELSQDEIDARFRAKEDAVLRCVERARPDEYTFVPGRVTVRFRIQRTGTVKGVQVEAPVILHKGGLTNCIKGVVSGLRFPASDSSQVISYPFSLL